MLLSDSFRSFAIFFLFLLLLLILVLLFPLVILIIVSSFLDLSFPRIPPRQHRWKWILEIEGSLGFFVSQGGGGRVRRVAILPQGFKWRGSELRGESPIFYSGILSASPGETAPPPGVAPLPSLSLALLYPPSFILPPPCLRLALSRQSLRRGPCTLLKPLQSRSRSGYRAGSRGNRLDAAFRRRSIYNRARLTLITFIIILPVPALIIIIFHLFQ